MPAIEGTTQTATEAAIRALYSEIKHGRLRPEEAVRRIAALRERVRAGDDGEVVAAVQRYAGAEAFLRDHTVGGKPVLVGVTHASLAVRAFFEWFPHEQAVQVQQLTFVKPVELRDDERAEVRVRRARNDGAGEVTAEFRVEPERAWATTATARVQRAEAAFGKMAPEAFPAALQPVADLDAIYAAGEPHFRVGESFRVIRQLYCGETEALARLDLSGLARCGAASYELHPLIAYSAFTAALPLLAGAGFREAFLPFGVKSLQFRRGFALDDCWLLVRLGKCSAEIALFDADVVTPKFDKVAELRGCSVKRLRLEPLARGADVATKRIQVSGTNDGVTAGAREYLLRKLRLDDGRPVDLEANLMELGLGSAQLVGLAAEMQAELGVELEPTVFFEYPSLRELSGYFAREHAGCFRAERDAGQLAQEGGGREADGMGAERVESWPLSEGQKGLWLLQQAAPEMTAYHCPLCFRVRPGLEPEIFEAACRWVIAEQPILGAAIEARGDEPVFVSRAVERFSVEPVDARGWSEAQMRAWIERALRVPFALEKGPLLRGALLMRGADESVAVLVVHHVAFDGASFGLFISAWQEAYQRLRAGERPQVRRFASGHADYVQAEARRLQGADGAKRLAYWREQLAGPLPQLDVPGDYPRAEAKLHAGRVVSTEIAAELGRAVKAFAAKSAVYPSAVFLGAFKLLLHVCAKQDDLVVGMPVTERGEARWRPLIGYFVNMIPLRSRDVGSRPWREFVKAVQRTMVTGLAQRYPFPALVRELGLSASGHPVFQAAFEYQNFFDAAAGQERGRGQEALPLEWLDGLHQQGEYELALEVYEQGEGFQLNFKFNPTLLHEDSARRMLRRIETILACGVARPDETIAGVALLGEDERGQLQAWNDTAAEYPRELCIHEWFERQASERPENVAVVFRGAELNYRELEARSGAVARWLQTRGVRPDAIVGLCVERSLEMVVAMLGILRAGGAYLPLDPDYPEERLQFMVRDSGTRWVLTQSHLAERARGIASEAEVVALDGDWAAVCEQAERQGELRREVRSRNLACVIYTSGSTGNPKGVMVEHQSMCNRIVWMQRAYQLTEDDVVLQKTPFSFDVSGWEFHWPMLVGARLVMAEPGKHRDPEYLRDIIRARGVTTLHFVPSMLQAFLAVPTLEECRSVRMVFCSGEELTVAQKDQFFGRFQSAALHNLYGPTEAAIDVTAWECRTEEKIVPIGRPISNVRLYIVDENLALAPVGVAGELCLAGDCLARGYLNRAELTAEKFIANPFEAGGRLYRTGDLARWLPDGAVQYLGRIDHQVKIRGFRIELGEIEAALQRVEGIEQAVVMAVDDASDGKRLAAYLVAPSGLPNLRGLRARLRQSLPDYMVPNTFVRIERVPLTSSGKIDRRALSQLPTPTSATSGSDVPRNDLEVRVRELWQRELRCEALGVHDDFFDVGGHSLLGLSLMARINAEFGVQLPLATLFEARTVAALAERLGRPATKAQEVEAVRQGRIVPLQANGSRRPLYLVPGVGGTGASFVPLSRALGDEQPVFVFQYPGLEDGEALGSIEALAEIFEAELRKQPRQVEYWIGGWSLGGVVAFEIACRLERRGLAVRLVLLDAYLAEHFAWFGTWAAVREKSDAGGAPAEIRRRADAVVAAGERALRAHRARGVFAGEAIYFHATEHGHGARDEIGREVRAIWEKRVPRVAERFVGVATTHHGIVAEPAVRTVAVRVREFLEGERVMVAAGEERGA